MTDLEPVAPTPPQPPHASSADMIGTVTKLDRAVKQRREDDTALTNWWLYMLLLSWITIGIYGIYLFFKRIVRIDAFSARKRAYYEAVLEWTERYAANQGKADTVRHGLADAGEEIRRAYANELKPINAGLSLLLTIVTIGFYSLYVLYRVNRYWWDAQKVEQDFDDAVSQVWNTLGIIKYPINFSIDSSKKRSYAIYLVLSIFTFGIWGLVWDYKIHTDPDRLYGEFHGIEDTVLQTVRTH